MKTPLFARRKASDPNPYLTGMALVAGTNSGLVSVPSVSSVTLPGGGANVRITFSAAHGIKDNQPVTISGTTGVTGLNATALPPSEETRHVLARQFQMP